MVFRNALKSQKFCSSVKFTSKRKGAKAYRSYRTANNTVRWEEIPPVKTSRGRTYKIDESFIPRKLRWTDVTDCSVTRSVRTEATDPDGLLLEPEPIERTFHVLAVEAYLESATESETSDESSSGISPDEELIFARDYNPCWEAHSYSKDTHPFPSAANAEAAEEAPAPPEGQKIQIILCHPNGEPIVVQGRKLGASPVLKRPPGHSVTKRRTYDDSERDEYNDPNYRSRHQIWEDAVKKSGHSPSKTYPHCTCGSCSGKDNIFIQSGYEIYTCICCGTDKPAWKCNCSSCVGAKELWLFWDGNPEQWQLELEDLNKCIVNP